MKHTLLVSTVLVLLSAGRTLAQSPVLPPADLPPPAFADAGVPLLVEPAETGTPRLWFQAAYLLEWLKASPVPVPLATSGVVTDPLPTALGQPGTRVVLGDGSIDPQVHSGAKFTMGYWLDEARQFGIEGSYSFLAGATDEQVVRTSGLPGSPNLGAPYFDVTGAGTLTGHPGESVYVLPGPLPSGSGGAVPGFAGVFTQTYRSSLQGAECNGLCNLYDGSVVRLNLLTGFRWLQLHEDLSLGVQTQGVSSAAPPVPGGFYNTLDDFRTINNFYGGQLGLRGELSLGRWSLRLSPRLALGDMRETVDIVGVAQTNGGNVFFSSGGKNTTPFPGGVFAQPSNIGSHSRNQLAVVTESELQLGYHPAEWLRLFVGYNLVYASAVVRPGEQINRNINTTQTGLAEIARAAGVGPVATGPAEPSFSFHDSSFWAQGIQWGAELRY